MDEFACLAFLGADWTLFYTLAGLGLATAALAGLGLAWQSRRQARALRQAVGRWYAANAHRPRPDVDREFVAMVRAAAARARR